MADLRIQHTEELVGANHATKPDTLNRLSVVEHNNDGTHGIISDFKAKSPWVDVRAHGAKGDGVTDDTGAIQDALDAMTGGGILFFPLGSYKITGPLYLTSSASSATYIIRGAGKGTILKPNAFTSGYLFKLNEDSNGTKILSFPRHPRVVFEDMYVNGTDSTSISFLWYNQASFQFRNMVFDYCLYGAYGTGYTDMVVMEDVTWANPRSGGWLYREGYLGDGFYGRHLFGTEVDMVYLYRSYGAALEACIGGRYKFEQSLVSVTNLHTENASGNHSITIKNSDVTMDTCWIRNEYSSYYPVYIDDDSTVTSGSRVAFRNNTFAKQANNSSARTREIQINALNNNSALVFENNQVKIFQFDVTDGVPWDLVPAGVTARSADSAIDAALLNRRQFLSGYAELSYQDGGWKVMRPDKGLLSVFALPDPSISALSEASDPAGSLAAGTYYYAVFLYAPDYIRTNLSTEVSIAKASSSTAIQMTLSAEPGSVAVVFRGTASGAYDKEVSIPIVSSSTKLFDTGGQISTFVWGTKSTATPTDNRTRDGLQITGNGTKMLWGTAAPVSGTWAAGDVVYNTSPAAGGSIGWVCVTAGAPGTWKTFGAISA